MEKNKKTNEMLKRLREDRMYRVFNNLQVRSEEIENEDGTKVKEMTIAEIEKELGYSIKVVKEEK